MRGMIVLCGLAGLLSACSGDPVGAAPTASGGKAPAAFVLHRSDMAGYKEQAATVLNAQTLAAKENDSTIAATLAQQGFQRGASDQFSDPGTTAPTKPFAAVISQALFFTSAQGAEQYFTAEMSRQRKVPAPDTGTKSSLIGLVQTGMDHVDGIEASAPAQSAGSPPVHAYFVLVRRGRVVASLTSYGDSTVATLQAFTALLVTQEHLLQASPD